MHGFSASPLLALKTFYTGFKTNAYKTVHTIKSESVKFNGGKWFLNLVDEVTFPTEILRDKYEKGIIVRSNIDLKKFKPKKTKKDIDVLYYGATWADKGINDLCESLKDTNIKVLIISRNPIPQELNSYLHCRNIRWIVGYVSDLENYINRAKFVVLPYRSLKGTEGNPSCLLEAVACKTPVITTNLPEIEEIFDNDEVLQIDPKNYEFLNCINYNLKFYKNAKERANKAYKKIKEFSSEKIAERFEEIYSY